MTEKAVASWYQEKAGQAEHLVYLDKKANELEKLISGEKNMIIRGAAGKKSPLGGRAKVDDLIYFVETGGDLQVTHRGIISRVVEDEKMTKEESHAFIEKFAEQLQLSPAQYTRWNGKRCLAVYQISQLTEIEAFTYNREKNMDDWIITDSIEEIKVK